MKHPDFHMSYWAVPGVRKPDMPTIYRTIDEAVSINRVIEMVCEHFSVSIERLRSKNRSRNICYPRHVAMYLIYQHCMKSCQNVGNWFNRDHTTVLHAIKSIKNLIETDPTIRREIDMFLLKII